MTIAPEPAVRLAELAAEAGENHTLDQLWRDKPGVLGFFSTVDHKRLGHRYIITAFVFFFLAGIQALIMRVQLSAPNADVVGANAYNELFTMHGTTMIFLFNTPVLAGFANYLLPLQLGSRDLAFPRLNAFSYWVFLMSGIFMYTSYLVGKPPSGGWFAYPPLTDKAYLPDIGMDFWCLGVIFVGISTTVGAVNFIVSIFKLRAPGMTLNRMPMFVWSVLAMAFMIVFAVPALTVAAGLLELDRQFGTAFYVPAHGGHPLLYQHLFWFWGHPEVYILFLPAVGMVSMMIPVFSRQRLVGYTWAVAAFMAIAFISFGVWVHHMFATGVPAFAMGVFSAASHVIAIPSGVLYFVWIATLWRGKTNWTVPMLFNVGFLLVFLIGGLTGVMVAALPFDWQATDTYFVVAHFHYVLNGAVVFPIFGAIYYWWPKITGKMLSESLGKWSFWTMLIGFNVSFFPMHILGLMGMPRRIYTYDDGLGWATLNVIVTIGGFAFGLGTLLTVVAVVRARRHGEPAGPNPWGADSLEWATTSPPPEYNFDAVPVVSSRHPLWDDRPLVLSAETTDEVTWSLGRPGTVNRHNPVLDGMEARPSGSLGIPRPTYLPVLVAAGLTIIFYGMLVTATVMAVVGIAAAVVGIAVWAWRTEGDLR